MSDIGAADPNFVPQTFWVEVGSGFEDCSFKIRSAKNTVPLVEIFAAHSENEPKQDLVPSNLVFSNSAGLPLMGSSFAVTFRSLKQGTMHRYRITTFDKSNGEAEVFGTFTTKSRKATAQIHHIFVSDPGDPPDFFTEVATGEVFMQFGLFQMETTSWSPNTGKSTKIGSVTWGYGDVTDGSVIQGTEFSNSGTIVGENVRAFLRVVFYAKDRDEDAAAKLHGVHFEDSGGEFMCPGSAGCDADGQPIAAAQGYDDGEWIRLVQDFPHLPNVSGSYNFPFTLSSNWGVMCHVVGHVTVEVIEGTAATVLYN